MTLSVRVTERVPLQQGLPDALPYQIIDLAGEVVDSRELIHNGEGIYTKEWVAPTDSSYRLVVLGEAAGLHTVTSQFSTDDIEPVFTYSLPSPSRPPLAPGLSYLDPDFAYAQAWRRDEEVTIEVRSTDLNIDPSTVVLTVTGVNESGSEGTQSIVPVIPVANCVGSYCGHVTVDLSKPQLLAMRGTFRLTFTGSDRAGNAGSSLGEIKVTRWKWRYFPTLPSSILHDLVLDGRGNIFRAVTNNYDSDLVALNHAGHVIWSKRATHFYGTSMGPLEGDNQFLYLGRKDTDGVRIIAYDTKMGTERVLCGPISGSLTSGLTTTKTRLTGEPNAIETAAGTLRMNDGGSVLLAARMGGRETCVTKENVGQAYGFTTPSSRLGEIYYATAEGSRNGWAYAYRFGSSGWEDAVGFPIDGVEASSLAIVGDNLLGSGQFGAFAIPVSGGGVSWFLKHKEHHSDVSVTAEQTVIYTDPFSRMREVEIGAASPLLTSSGFVSQSTAASIGQGGLLYTFTALSTESNSFEVYSRALQRQWGFSDNEILQISPLLDCTRNAEGVPQPGRSGVAYLAGRRGSVTALVVDSRGIDTSAPWPRYRRDPRYSGSVDTSLEEFKCP